MSNHARGLIVAAPASNSGKTTVTLALLRSLRRHGVRVASAKIGPDYIDPGFHTLAGGRVCYNLDAWAMRCTTLAALAQRCGENADLLVVEGVMGLFDGAPDGSGSTADIAALSGWPVVLVVDAQGMAASAAALVHGFASFRPGLKLAGVIFNRIGGLGHARLLIDACAPLGISVVGCLPRKPELTLPDRHLGLVPAQEHPELDAFLDGAADFLEQHLDIDALRALARPSPLHGTIDRIVPPLGQRIALAQDVAFAFCYPFVLDTWRAAGAEILPFSPLADAAPDERADAVYLPGGYPELHAGRLAANRCFLDGLRGAAARGATLYGECGGYMTLGRGLIDAEGERHAMAGLLPVETSFAERGLHLGYRRLQLLADGPLGQAGQWLRGHEFHFAKLLGDEGPAPLFRAVDARGQDLGPIGARVGTVTGSFAHLIDLA